MSGTLGKAQPAEELVRGTLLESIQLIQELEKHHIPVIVQMADAISVCFENRGKLLLFGNGGSAADSQHLAAELVGRFKQERIALPALALTTDTSILTAIGNDYGHEFVFARQVEAFATEKDAIVAISTSGKSPNVLRALRTARAKGARCFGLTGGAGEPMKGLCDICLVVPSRSTPRIQEAHIAIGHILCDLIESRLVKRESRIQ